MRPCERDLFEVSNCIDQLLRIIEENEPKIRQDIQITKERLEAQKQANKKLEEKLAKSQQRIRDQEKYIDELRAELSG